MPRNAFSHVEYWVFDLDNTLYPPSVRLFDQIEVRMTKYVAESLGVPHAEADRMRLNYWQQYGTTLAGLMREHDVDPTPYLTTVHDIDMSALQIDRHLADQISALPGRKIVYTNGTAPYAQRVLEGRGLGSTFDAVYGVENANFLPKPERRAFETIFAIDGLATQKAAMFEDEHRNLQAPHAMGMKTVHVAKDSIDADHIHHHTDDLSAFLDRLL
ncbi:MAG: pyrimidine 5'-nucleotidase [Paracoccaceae bacterium]|nr:pyrimidine 5'-nucleotidase [Paracoccaceae bacterium]MDG2258294.1 pyrimidine 5'-nucleotidase [Paracoccaceae bacterium]